MPERNRHIARKAFGLLGLVALVGLVGFGWHRASVLTVTEVFVSGAVHAEAEHLRSLAAVADSVLLFDLNPRAISERVEADPWVHEARVTRWMTGRLEIAVREREPVMLVLEAGGRPSHYLDVHGHALPVVESAMRAGYDVPLLIGSMPRLRPGHSVDDAAILRLLSALATAEPGTDALISAIERWSDGQLVLLTAPPPSGAAIPVLLGRDGFPEKLRRLDAFWEQAILSRPDHTIRRIDLRFDGQIVTDEDAGHGALQSLIQ